MNILNGVNIFVFFFFWKHLNFVTKTNHWESQERIYSEHKVLICLVYKLKSLIKKKNLSWVYSYDLLRGNKIFLILKKWRRKLVMRLWQRSWSRCGNCGTSSWQLKEPHQLDIFWKWEFIMFKPQYRSQYLKMVVITVWDFDRNTRCL